MTVRNYLRDTQTNPGTGGDTYDLSEEQGSPVATVNATINDTAYVEGARWQDTVDDRVTDTSFPISVNVDSIAGTLDYHFRLQRVDSADNVIASSDYSTAFVDAGIKTFTIAFDAGTWATGDRLRLTVELRRTGGHGNVDINVSVQDADSYVDGELTEAPSEFDSDDSGVGSEDEGTSAVLTNDDTGSGSDSEVVDKAFASTDSGTGLESQDTDKPFGPPDNITVTDIDETTLRIDWDIVDDATSYDIRRERWDGGAWVSTTTVANEVQPPYDDSDLQQSTDYRYGVRSVL